MFQILVAYCAIKQSGQQEFQACQRVWRMGQEIRHTK